jgi:hypothetical protein
MSTGAAAGAQQRTLPALEAEIVTTYTLSQRSYSTRGRYHRAADGRGREDSPLGAVIIDAKQGTVTMLNHAKKEARIVTFSHPSRPRTERLSRFVAFEEAMVESHTVVKTRASGRPGEHQELWTARDLGLVLLTKVDGPAFRMTRELRNISLREPDTALFQLPDDYVITTEAFRPDDLPAPGLPTKALTPETTR